MSLLEQSESEEKSSGFFYALISNKKTCTFQYRFLFSSGEDGARTHDLLAASQTL